jgi:hypothetical protein
LKPISEASKIAIFRIIGSVLDHQMQASAIKIDIVKPMPAKNPTSNDMLPI